MLKSLLGIALLTASNSAATFQTTPKTTVKQPQIQMLNSESVNQDGNVDYQLTLDRQNQYDDTRAGSKSQKVTYNAYNSYLLANAEIIKYQYYANADSTDTDDTHALVINDHTTSTDNEYYSQCIMMLQITPYLYNANTEIDTTVGLAFSISQTADYQNVPIDYAYTNIQLYSTTNNLANYMGTANWANNGFVNSIQEDLQNPQLGYTYSFTEQNTDHLTAGSRNVETINFNISIVPNQINYFFIFSTTHVYSTELLNINRVKIGARAGNIDYPYQNQITFIQLNGTGIIPAETTEIVDIPGIMFTILGMPWYFISTAFNLTLFPGTPYQLNISSLFLAIIAVFIFIFLLRLLLKVGK